MPLPKRLTIPECEAMLVARLERRGYRVICQPCMDSGMVDSKRRLVRYGYADPTTRLATLAHEYAHTLGREPAYMGNLIMAFCFGKLDACCQVWRYELLIWQRADRILRWLNPKGFSWSKHARRKAQNFARELRMIARQVRCD